MSASTNEEMSVPTNMEGPVCPVPLPHRERIVMGHGSGGKMSHDLIARVFLPSFDNPALRAGDDSGVVRLPLCAPSLSIGSTDSPVNNGNGYTHIAVTTDSHVVSPLFFPGGDIGRLAVCGTVNDLAVMGATPLYLTAGFILEEGLDIEILQRVIASMQEAATESGVQIIAGDTKVVQRGKADGLYITTSGVGMIPPGVEIGGKQAKPGDVVILSGPIGDHGIAVLGARGELGFEADIQSDTAPLNGLVAAMMGASPTGIHVMRDPTRGGLATTLNEIAHQSKVSILLDERSIPVHSPVAAACEMLGFDPLYVANEGKLIAIVSREEVGKILAAMKQTHYGEEAIVIGEIKAEPPGRVLMKTTVGSTRIVDVLAGEMLPRIC